MVALKRIQAIREIRDATRGMIDADRSVIKDGGSWIDFSPFFSYILDLSPEHLMHVRLHGQLFGGGDPAGLLSAQSAMPPAQFEVNYGYAHAVHDIPERYLISEPPLQLADGREKYLGCKIGERWVTPDTARYQNYIANLYRIGFLDWIETLDRPITVLEFGPGYGAFGYYLMQLFPGKIRYVVVDLPVMLMFSGAFLAANLDEPKVWNCDTANAKPIDLNDGKNVYLVPGHRIDLLQDIDAIDLAINTISMPEMPPRDMERYLDYLRGRLRGIFYYHNQEPEQHPAIDAVSARFQCLPSVAMQRSYAEGRRDPLAMYDVFAFPRHGGHFTPRMAAGVYLRMSDLAYIKTSLGAATFKRSWWPQGRRLLGTASFAPLAKRMMRLGASSAVRKMRAGKKHVTGAG